MKDTRGPAKRIPARHREAVATIAKFIIPEATFHNSPSPRSRDAAATGRKVKPRADAAMFPTTKGSVVAAR